MAVAGIEVVGTQWRKCRTLYISVIMSSRNIRAVPSSAMISPPMLVPYGEFPFTLGPNVVVSSPASTTVYDALAKP